MTTGFHIPSMLEQVKTSSSETRSFDPDHRVEAKQLDNAPVDSFNPDKRLSDAGTPTETRSETTESDGPEKSLEKVIGEYAEELKKLSEVPDTLPNKPVDASELRRLSTEELGAMKSEYVTKRLGLIEQWEIKNGREWPKYEKDVVNERGVVVRKAGMYYDAHHITPLCLGGKNEASNLTPLHVYKHQSKQGIHRKDGACDRMVKLVEARQ